MKFICGIFMSFVCFFKCLFLAWRVSRSSKNSTGQCGAGMCELCGCGHQHLLRDTDEVDDTWRHIHVVTSKCMCAHKECLLNKHTHMQIVKQRWSRPLTYFPLAVTTWQSFIHTHALAHARWDQRSPSSFLLRLMLHTLTSQTGLPMINREYYKHTPIGIYLYAWSCMCLV